MSSLAIAAVIAATSAGTASGTHRVADPGTDAVPEAATLDDPNVSRLGGDPDAAVLRDAADGPAARLSMFAWPPLVVAATDAPMAPAEGRVGSAPRPKPTKTKSIAAARTARPAPKPKPKPQPKPQPKAKVAPKPAPAKPRPAPARPKPKPKAAAAVAPRTAPRPRTTTAASTFSGSFRWPVPGGRISRGYAGSHHGLDIYAPQGTPVLASAGGKVVFTGWRYGGGYNVWIEHRPGLYTAYAHLSRIYARKGSIVRAGQRIGAVGATGWATGPHLHLEVWSGGYPGGKDRRVDPLRYVRR